jgi:hypothetical protein
MDELQDILKEFKEIYIFFCKMKILMLLERMMTLYYLQKNNHILKCEKNKLIDKTFE